MREELEEELDYLETLEHEENSRALDLHLDFVEGKQGKGWY